MMCDRFHYRSHKCSLLYDPDTFPVCDAMCTSVAESLNRKWARSRNHSRYLHGDNIIPFLLARSIFLNLRALARDAHGKGDLEDCDVLKLYDTVLPCTCSRGSTQVQ